MMIPADNKSLGCSQNPLNTLHTSCILYCSVPENTHTHPMEGQIMEIPRGRRVSKAKILKFKYGA